MLYAIKIFYNNGESYIFNSRAYEKLSTVRRIVTVYLAPCKESNSIKEIITYKIDLDNKTVEEVERH